MTTALLILGGIALFFFVSVSIVLALAVLGWIELTNPEDLEEDGSE